MIVARLHGVDCLRPDGLPSFLSCVLADAYLPRILP